jgi:hypothetical protein
MLFAVCQPHLLREFLELVDRGGAVHVCRRHEHAVAVSCQALRELAGCCCLAYALHGTHAVQ